MKVRVKLVLHLARGLVVLLFLSTSVTSQSIEDLASDCSNCDAISCNCTKVSVERFSVSNVDRRSTSLNWDRLNIASVNGYAIVYRFDGNKEVDFITSNATTTTVLRGLRPFTNYTVWIRPSCETGFALCTVPVTFMTMGDRPDEAPQNVEVIKYQGGILVTWLPPPRETHNGPLTGYIITITNLENATTTEYGAEGTSHTLSSLSPGRYALRIKAVNDFGKGPDTSSAVDFTILQPVSESEDFNFWESNYRYLLIPVVIVLAILIVLILLFIKWKYYPSTVLYCKDIVEKQTHVYADQRSPTDVATEFSFSSPFPHTQLQTQSVSSNSEENSHSTVPLSAPRVLDVSPPNHQMPENHMLRREITSPNDSDSVFGPYAEVGLQKHCSPGVKYPPIPNMSRHPSLWPNRRNRMGIGRANSTAGDTTTTLPAHAVDLSNQPSPYEVPHSVTDPAESLTLSDPSINQDDFSPPGRMHLAPYPNQPVSSSKSNVSPYNMRMQQNSMASMHSAASHVPPPMYPPSRQHHEPQEVPAQGASPRVLGQKHITQSQTSMGSIPPVPFHHPPPLTKSSLDLVARLEKGHESIEDLMETIEQVEQEERQAFRVRPSNGPTNLPHSAVPFYSEPFDNPKKPPEDGDPSSLQSGAKNSSSLPRFTRMNSVPNTLGEDLGKKHHKISVPSNIMMAGATPPIHTRSNINRFPSTRSEQPLPYLKEQQNYNQDHFSDLDESVPYVPPSSISDCR